MKNIFAIRFLKKQAKAFNLKCEEFPNMGKYEVYKIVGGDYKFRYRTKTVSKSLAKETKKRCPFCGRPIFINKSNLPDELLMTIEHIEPKKVKPDKIYDFSNMVACCHRCNESRGDNHIKWGDLQPKIISNFVKNFSFDYEGKKIAHNEFGESVINGYYLNGRKKDFTLLFQRREYVYKVINKNYGLFIKLRKKYKLFNDSDIEFVDVYNFFRKGER